MNTFNSNAQNFIDETLVNSLSCFERLIPDNGEFHKFSKLADFMDNFIFPSSIETDLTDTTSFYDVSKDVLYVHVEGANSLGDLCKSEIFKVLNALSLSTGHSARCNWINAPQFDLETYKEEVQLLIMMFTSSLIAKKFGILTYQSEVCESLAKLNDGSKMSSIAKISISNLDYISNFVDGH